MFEINKQNKKRGIYINSKDYSSSKEYNSLIKLMTSYSFERVDLKENVDELELKNIDLIIIEQPQHEDLLKLEKLVVDQNKYLVITRYGLPQNEIYQDETNSNIFLVTKLNLASEVYKTFEKKELKKQ
jgi:hypothetical protein